MTITVDAHLPNQRGRPPPPPRFLKRRHDRREERKKKNSERNSYKRTSNPKRRMFLQSLKAGTVIKEIDFSPELKRPEPIKVDENSTNSDCEIIVDNVQIENDLDDEVFVKEVDVQRSIENNQKNTVCSKNLYFLTIIQSPKNNILSFSSPTQPP